MKGKSNWLLFLAGVILAGGVIFGVYYFLVKRPSLSSEVSLEKNLVEVEETDVAEEGLPEQPVSQETDLSGQGPAGQSGTEKQTDSLPDVSDSGEIGSDQASSEFSVGGYLLPDSETGEGWMVLYDDPVTGSPAATLHLAFTSQSLCDFGQGEAICDPGTFMEGDQIDAVGVRDGRELMVKIIKGAVVRPIEGVKK